MARYRVSPTYASRNHGKAPIKSGDVVTAALLARIAQYAEKHAPRKMRKPSSYEEIMYELSHDIAGELTKKPETRDTYPLIQERVENWLKTRSEEQVYAMYRTRHRDEAA